MYCQVKKINRNGSGASPFSLYDGIRARLSIIESISKTFFIALECFFFVFILVVSENGLKFLKLANTLATCEKRKQIVLL